MSNGILTSGNVTQQFFLESREPRAESREPRAESREPRAESREPRAESREPMTRRLVSCLLLAMLGLAAPAWAATDVILASPSPGTLEVTWTLPDNVTPTDYRVMWARADQGFGSWRDPNTETRGNEYPTTNSLTLTGLEEGETYRVKVRSRQASGGKFVWQSPWSEVVSLQVSTQPASQPTTQTTRQLSPQPRTQIVTPAVSVGGSATGAIDAAGERDRFTVEVVYGKGYFISLVGSGDSPLACPRVHDIYDADDAPASGVTDTFPPLDMPGEVSFSPAESATYTIEVDACDGTGTGGYELSVEENVDDFDGASSTTGRVTVGTTGTDGEIEAIGDEDWFAIDLEAGCTYVVKVQAGGHDYMWNGYAGLEDAVAVGVYDSESNVILEPLADLSELRVTTSSAGTHYVSAAGAGSAVGNYVIRVTKWVPPPPPSQNSFAVNRDTAVEVRVGDSLTSRVEAGGRNWYKLVGLEADSVYQLWIGSMGTMSYESMANLYDILDSGGSSVRSRLKTNGALKARKFLMTGSGGAGDYYFSVGGWDTNCSEEWCGALVRSRKRTGTYKITLTKVTGDDYSADTGTTARLEMNGDRVVGSSDYYSDQDWFAVDLVAGQRYRAYAVAIDRFVQTLVPPMTPYFKGLYDSNGDKVGGITSTYEYDGDNRAWMYFTAGESGTYYVSVMGISYTCKDMYNLGDYRVEIDER